VRGYVAGSAWKEYRVSGTIHEAPITAGLREADRLPEPIFTPSTKAALGDHDENISFERARELIGRELADRVREVSLAIFKRASVQAESAGFLLADTKFEFGIAHNDDGTSELVLADEVLTPDSSRFWKTEDWAPGATPQGYDKQPVRDYLESLYWDKRPPAPPLPVDVVAATSQRYRDAYELITGQSLDKWYPS
ncbi:MAG: phosphoribosylaminoimidazolesuccinocarboxamide synthase, partial [Microthrixaceae bacterium]|nr:phosphoribosylaminoimidazolesuccinocarboxamide synthase [Microthrixaceae bacterium]